MTHCNYGTVDHWAVVDLQNILRFIVRLSELIVKSTYDGDLQRAEISLRNIV